MDETGWSKEGLARRITELEAANAELRENTRTALEDVACCGKHVSLYRRAVSDGACLICTINAVRDVEEFDWSCASCGAKLDLSKHKRDAGRKALKDLADRYTGKMGDQDSWVLPWLRARAEEYE